jgi:tetratricopeptide (TPR) repeat protein
MRRLPAWLAIALLLQTLSARADDNEAARAHFQVGQSYYDEANYAEALKAFKEAHRLSKRPALHYNIALCHERLEHYSEAIASLEAYLTEVPEATDRKLVEGRIANLREREARERERKEREARDAAARAKPPEPAPASPAVVEQPPPKRRRVATWVVGGLGLGLLAGSVAQAHYDYLQSHCPGDRCDTTVTQADKDYGRTLTIATDVLWPIGLVAVGTAVALFFIEGRPKKGGGVAFVTRH